GDQHTMSQTPPAIFQTPLTASATPTQALADWCSRLDPHAIPHHVAHEASRHVIDTLAACAAGMPLPLPQAAIALERNLNTHPGTIPIFGAEGTWTLPEAASLMATACH